MKIAVLGDTHFGARNDHIAFHDYFEKFYRDVFFPTLKERDIKTVIQLGDLFYRRKYINFYTLKRTREYFLDRLVEDDIFMHVFVGNHDTYFKNTNEINSPELLLQDYSKNLAVYSEPVDIEIDGTLMALLPWVCSGNYEESMEYIDNTKAQILFGHLELAGFAMYKGAVNDHGMDRKIFDRFDTVISGHYHHKSSQGNIHYLGTPYEMTWSDFDDSRGFHIFDTETRELEFVRNPNTMFSKVLYDDSDKTLEDIVNFDASDYKSKYVKVIVREKENPYWFDMFIDKLEKAGLVDLQVLDDHLNLNLEDDEDIVNEAEDTLTILSKVVNQLEESVDKKSLDLFLRNLYTEALQVE